MQEGSGVQPLEFSGVLEQLALGYLAWIHLVVFRKRVGAHFSGKV